MLAWYSRKDQVQMIERVLHVALIARSESNLRLSYRYKFGYEGIHIFKLTVGLRVEALESVVNTRLGAELAYRIAERKQAIKWARRGK